MVGTKQKINRFKLFHLFIYLYIGNVTNSIGMVVAFIPEGLPAAVTLVLTIVAKRMYKQKVLVKSLATVETFNTVSVNI